MFRLNFDESLDYVGSVIDFQDNALFTYQFSCTDQIRYLNEIYGLDASGYITEFCEISGCANRIFAVDGSGSHNNDFVYLVENV